MSTVLLKINGECYKLVMETMAVISLRMPAALRESLTQVAERLNETEGEFIRRSIAIQLREEGETIPDEVLKRKSRKGVGGYPTHRTKATDRAKLRRRPAGSLAPADFYQPSDPPDNAEAITQTASSVPTPKEISGMVEKMGQERIRAYTKSRKSKPSV